MYGIRRSGRSKKMEDRIRVFDGGGAAGKGTLIRVWWREMVRVSFLSLAFLEIGTEKAVRVSWGIRLGMV